MAVRQDGEIAVATPGAIRREPRRDTHLRPHGTRRIYRLERAAAVTVGAAIPLTGFPPLNNVADVVDITTHPGRVVVLPALVLAVISATWAAFVDRRTGAWPRIALTASGVLLFVGGTLSILGSGDPTDSALRLVIGISVPILLFIALMHASLPAAQLSAGFVAMSCLLMLRADFVFFQAWGIPTSGDLFTAKFSNAPYDFHYYSLGNPDHTAGFLLLPYALSLFWALAPDLSPRMRMMTIGGAAICFVSLVLLYSRSALAVAVSLALLAIAVSSLPRAMRWFASGIAVLFVAAAAITGWDYIRELTSTAPSASAQQRFSSLGEGLATMADHPLTGVGLGQYGPAGGYYNAHSSVVQAGAEMGVVGFAALLLLTGTLIVLAIEVLRRCGWIGLRAGAAVATATYAAYSAIAAPASEALFNGYTSVWGLGLALTAAVMLGGANGRSSVT